MSGSSRNFAWGIALFFFYVAAFILFQFFAKPVYTDSARWLAWLLFVMGTWPMAKFLRHREGVPLVELVLLNYVLFFALPVLFQDHLSIYIGTVIPGAESIELTLACAILAIIMLQVGFLLAKTVLIRHHLPRLQLVCSEQRLFIFALLVLAGWLVTNLNLLPVSVNLRRVMGIIFSRDLGIALLALLYYRDKLSSNKRIAAIGLLVVAMLFGLIGGMTQDFLQPLLVWYLCSWFVTRTLPYRSAAIIIVLFLLLQPVKLDYRSQVWFDNPNMSLTQKAELYLSLLSGYWLSSGNIIEKGVETNPSRLSLLMQTAHVIEWTPDRVPYKHGDTLLYMIYTWVPRVLWSGKPIAQQANVSFALDYGIQHPNTIDTARFGIGHLGEAYINFSIAGVFVIMLILGMMYYLPLAIIDYQTGSIAALGLLTVTLVNFIFIGSTISNVFGSFVQQIVVQAFLLKTFAGVKIRL